MPPCVLAGSGGRADSLTVGVAPPPVLGVGDGQARAAAGATANGSPHAITAGPDGAMWFAEGSANRIGRLALGPTSVDDCKNGGYRVYGFTNQGRCIAAVNHPQP
jgi:virginiamycin B lyase